ncbi:MAG: hypothetical protein J6J77_03265, partial [Alistipes sp.]|nr:hypothetical protein [Alistipes sp.]
MAIYPKRNKPIFAWAALKKDADEKRKTLILLFSPAFILKNQKTHPTLIFGSKNGCNLVTALFTPLLTERGRLTSISMEIRIF